MQKNSFEVTARVSVRMDRADPMPTELSLRSSWGPSCDREHSIELLPAALPVG